MLFANGAAYAAFSYAVATSKGVGEEIGSNQLADKAKEISCSSRRDCRKEFNKLYRSEGVREVVLKGQDRKAIEALIADNQDTINVLAQQNLQAESSGLVLVEDPATGAYSAIVGEPTPGNPHRLSGVPNFTRPANGRVVLLHFHPSKNNFGTQLWPSVGDLLYSQHNDAIMVNVNPRNTSEFRIYKGELAR